MQNLPHVQALDPEQVVCFCHGRSKLNSSPHMLTSTPALYFWTPPQIDKQPHLHFLMGDTSRWKGNPQAICKTGAERRFHSFPSLRSHG